MSDVPEKLNGCYFQGRWCEFVGDQVFMSEPDPWFALCDACGGEGISERRYFGLGKPYEKQIAIICSACDGKGTTIA